MKNYNKAKKISDDIFNIMKNTPKFDTELRGWIEENNSAPKIINKFSDSENLSKILSNFVREEKHTEGTKLLKKLTRNKRILMARRISAVAAALIAVSFLLWQNLFVTEIALEGEIATIETVDKSIIKPTLILANGKKIAIDNSQTVKAVTLTNDAITDNIEYHTLIVPKKYTLKIDLEDGTIMHINANSKLRYPSKFTGEKREVFLDGEAFFEVAKSKKPFIVNSNNTEIKVYGTKFNVNSYSESSVITLLIEGSVGITVGGKETILKPNQLSVVNTSKNETVVSDVSPEKYIAWMDGYFRYDNDHLESFIEELGRWHDVKFNFKNEKDKNLLITSSFKRTLTLAEILNATSKTTNLKFKLEKGVYIIE